MCLEQNLLWRRKGGGRKPLVVHIRICYIVSIDSGLVAGYGGRYGFSVSAVSQKKSCLRDIDKYPIFWQVS